MSLYTTITIDGTELNILSANPTRKQKTRKSIIGRTLVEVNVIGLSAQQWEMKINGIITGTDSADLSAKRAVIEALDDVEVHALIDGIHDGNYYIQPNSLSFDDNGDSGNMTFKYSLTLVEV
jgi:hypothetical protein